jgi:hypothetical protein
MAEAARTLGIRRRPIPSEAELHWLHENFLHPSIDAINYCPAEHRGQHIGVIMHTLLIGLPREDQHDAFSYLQTVPKQSTPGTPLRSLSNATAAATKSL